MDEKDEWPSRRSSLLESLRLEEPALNLRFISRRVKVELVRDHGAASGNLWIQIGVREVASRNGRSGDGISVERIDIGRLVVRAVRVIDSIVNNLDGSVRTMTREECGGLGGESERVDFLLSIFIESSEDVLSVVRPGIVEDGTVESLGDGRRGTNARHNLENFQVETIGFKARSIHGQEGQEVSSRVVLGIGSADVGEVVAGEADGRRRDRRSVGRIQLEFVDSPASVPCGVVANERSSKGDEIVRARVDRDLLNASVGGHRDVHGRQTVRKLAGVMGAAPVVDDVIVASRVDSNLKREELARLSGDDYAIPVTDEERVENNAAIGVSINLRIFACRAVKIASTGRVNLSSECEVVRRHANVQNVDGKVRDGVGRSGAIERGSPEI